MDFSKFKSMRKKPGVLALAVKGTTAELLIYDIIGEDIFGDGVSAKDVVQQLSAAGDLSSITVRINSPGGDVDEGLAIYNALATHPATINVQIDGVAASIATVIAMAGDSITIAPTGLMMIHNAWGIVAGDAPELRAIADVMDKHSEAMAVAYARSGKTTEDIRAIMDAETWYSAQEALDAGWVDSVAEMPVKSLAAKAKYNLAAFRNPPAEAVQEEPEQPTAIHVHVDARGADASEVQEAIEQALDDCKNTSETAENIQISAEIRQKALIRAQKRAENLRLAAIS